MFLYENNKKYFIIRIYRQRIMLIFKIYYSFIKSNIRKKLYLKLLKVEYAFKK